MQEGYGVAAFAAVRSLDDVTIISEATARLCACVLLMPVPNLQM